VNGAVPGAVSAETAPIGGAFELDAATLLELGEGPRRFADAQSVTSGRAALALLAEQAPGRWLLPAYICDTALEPLRAAGIEVDFYSVGDDLRPRLDELERAIAADPPSALLVVDYFGFPPEDADRLRMLRDACLVVEDCVHGSLLELPDHAGGRIGEVAFTAFRKYLPVPDGGIVIGVEPRELPPADGPGVRGRLLGQLLRGAAGAGEVPYAETEPIFLHLLETAETALSESPVAATSTVTERLLARLDLAAAAARRRENFTALLEAIADFDAVTPLVRELPPGVSPLLLPIRVAAGARDSLRAALISRRVYCPVHWFPLPEEIDADRFGDEHRLSRELLGLPIDQRYEPADMERVARELAAARQELT
jgi:dTDP-4-amino-4,6-dideoxygalactose transaminase